jgi:hypothetical protein
LRERCLNWFAHVTQLAQFVRAPTAKDAGLLLAQFVPIDAPMLSKGTTWPPNAPSRTRGSSGSIAPTKADRVDSSRSPSDPAAEAHAGESRTPDPSWEAVIDRATD